MENQARNHLEQKILAKAMKDPAFREQLLLEPRRTLAEEFGFEIPDKIEINVLEERPDRFYFVLPRAGTGGPEFELSDADLKLVSGGTASTYTQDDPDACD